MKHSHRRLCALGLLALVFAGGCRQRGAETPSAPTSTSALNLAGAWRGTASDSSGPGTITMQVTQSGTTVSGTVSMTVTGTSTTGRGTLAGTLSGSAIRLTITIPAGGFDAPYTSCNAEVSGDGDATASSITARYSGTNSCGGPVTGGRLDLTKG